MQRLLADLKTKYKSSLEDAVRKIGTLRANVDGLQLQLQQAQVANAQANTQIRNQARKLECPICLDKQINTITNYGHAHCRECTK